MSASIDHAGEQSASSDTKQDPVDEQPATRDTKTTQNITGSEAPSQLSTDEPAVDKDKSTYTGMAASAATSATSAAVGVKDNLFSMFGGGTKKEKREEPEDDPEEISGSSKQAKKETEAEGEVSLMFPKDFDPLKFANCLSACQGRRARIS